MLLYIVVTGIA